MRDADVDYRVEFVPEPVSWTEVPSTLQVLRSQRRRWHRGLWETLWQYRGMLSCARATGGSAWSRCRTTGSSSSSRPLLELYGLVIVPIALLLGVVNVPFALLFLALAYGYAILVTLAAMAMEEWAFHRHERWRDLGTALSVLGPGELRLPPADRLVAARGLVGEPARQQAGVGRDDPHRLQRGGLVRPLAAWDAPGPRGAAAPGARRRPDGAHPVTRGRRCRARRHRPSSATSQC